MKRALAWMLDLLPLVAYAVYAAPALYCLWVLRKESADGIGIFDASLGRDPVVLSALKRLPDLRLAFGGAALWVALQLYSRWRRGLSIAESMLVVRQRGSRKSALVVDAFRYGLPLALIAVATFAPRDAGVQADAAEAYKAYVPMEHR